MIELKPMKISEILDITFKIVFDQFKNFLKIFMFFLVCIIILVSSIFFYIYNNFSWLFDKMSKNFKDLLDFPYLMMDNNIISSLLKFIPVIFIGIIIYFILTTFFVGMTTDLFSKRFLGIYWNFRDSFNSIKNKILNFLFLSIISFFILLCGFLICCIGIIPAWTFISLAIPSLFIENLTGIKSIKRSFQLVNYDFFSILGSILLLWIILFFSNFLFQFLSPLIAFLVEYINNNYDISYLNKILIICGIILIILIYITYFLITQAITYCYFVVLYYNQKIKYENFGIQFLVNNYINNNISNETL